MAGAKNNGAKNSGLLLLAAAGLVGGLTSVAAAQPYLINISGATLLENFIKSAGSTNDFLDLDGDGNCGPCNGVVDQLAPFGLNPFPASGRWIVQYRVVGSVNGFIELTKFGSTFVTTDSTDTNGLTSVGATLAYHNRQLYINAGALLTGGANIGNFGNPGGAPVRSDTTTLSATYAANPTPSAGGIRIDIAPLDVPSRWAVRNTTGSPDLDQTPGALGYGNNPRKSVNRDGGTTGFGNLGASLPDLNGRNLFDPSNPGAADSNTLFDQPLAWAPIVPMTNLGTGITQLKMSEVRHLFATGRLASGENLHAITRDVGSGTRNAFNNTTGLDPSWGVGDNVGGLSTLAVNNNLGPQFTPTNKGGNSGVENTVFNSRLGIGYVGAERGVAGAWLTGSNPRAEILAVQNDLYGGTQFRRPTIDAVLDNDANGYVIGGPAALVTIGDPRAEPVARGGDNNGRPKMRNPYAAEYLNNLRKSTEAFVAVPGGLDSEFMPGEVLATILILSEALDNAHSFTNPTQLIPTPAFNLSLQNYIRSNNVLANSVYQNFNLSATGRSPIRTTGITYSDGVVNGANYISQSGAAITYNTALSLRNKIAGDFNGDGKRDINDASEMLKAFRQRNGGPTWSAPNGTGLAQSAGGIAGAPGTDACIEILGDFDGNGSFNVADIRYWADGLGVNATTRVLDRKAAFEAIDNAWFALTGSNNFFGTTKSGGPAYIAGESRFDIASASGANARGWAPVGADGVIDTFDLNFTKAQFQGNDFVTDGEANWTNTFEAVGFDLSADNTGDLVVNTADVDAIKAALGICDADFNGDGFLDFTDFDAFVADFEAGAANADFNGDGFLDFTDFDAFVAAFEAGC
ncbi:MAG: EF-hand domain-containing protein [Planctomycetota bacterium]|nr:EF-hand domain-containing protein [Planctomycetota bacterium]